MFGFKRASGWARPRLGDDMLQSTLGKPMARMAAGLLAGTMLSVGAASAADLMPTKAQAQYMKRCTAEGEGFYYIPGTDTCLRIGGYVWMEGYYNTFSNYPTNYNDTYTIATAAAILDARTQTEYGTLRSYMEARFRWRTSDPWSDGPNGSEIELWNAYVQFGGFTFGLAQSFFDFYANANVLGTDPGTIGDDTRANLAAYTMEFGQGWSATVSFEDGNFRKSGSYPANPSWAWAIDDYDAGSQLPAFVGNVKVEQAWGSAQLSGAIRQVRTLDLYTDASSDNTWGYALQAGVMFNLPMLGEGDTLYLQSAYADGAISYLGLQDPTGMYTPPDAFVSVYGVSKVSGWNFTASLLHNWNAKWSSAVFGGYASYDLNDSVAEAFYGASGGNNYNVGGYIAFAPVSNFSIALQYDYTYNEATDYVPTLFSPSAASTDANRVLLMVSRDF